MLVAFATIGAAPAALAWTCASRSFDSPADPAKLLLASSEQVFVGRVTKLDYLVPMWDYAWTVATFAPERVFKGKSAQPIRVYVKAGVQVGNRLLVFARLDNRQARIDSLVQAKVVGAWPLRSASSLTDLPRLAADGLCKHSAYLLTEGSEGADYLRALEQLPPPGSGGELTVNAYWVPYGVGDQSERVCLSRRAGLDAPTLTLTGAQMHEELALDWRSLNGGGGCKGLALSPMPEGIYRLAAKAPPGYRVSCNEGSKYDCDLIPVADRGLTALDVHIKPDAQVRIYVQDGRGRPSDRTPSLHFRRLDAEKKGLPFRMPAEFVLRAGASPFPLPSGRYDVDLLPDQDTAAKGDGSAERQKQVAERKTLLRALEIKPGEDRSLLIRLP